jgi:hypothetical protein
VTCIGENQRQQAVKNVKYFYKPLAVTRPECLIACINFIEIVTGTGRFIA